MCLHKGTFPACRFISCFLQHIKEHSHSALFTKGVHMRRILGRKAVAFAAGLFLLCQGAFPAFAQETGPGAGLQEASGMTINHGGTGAASGGGSGKETAPAGMTAVELPVTIAEITGNTGVWLSAAPGSGENYGYAYPKTVYRVIEDAGNGWIKIAYDGHDAYLDGNSGEITQQNVWMVPEGDQEFADLLRTAIGALGSHYQPGGTDPAVGVDCSGFVQYVMKNGAGIDMPRTSAEQAAMGTDRAPEDMRVGDLVAYGSSLGSVGHVGIYIGNGRIIHGDGTGRGVTICVWNDRTDIPRIANVLGS